MRLEEEGGEMELGREVGRDKVGMTPEVEGELDMDQHKEVALEMALDRRGFLCASGASSILLMLGRWRDMFW